MDTPLLTIMKTSIASADYSIFDLSDWNPNVALELGISEGIYKNSLKNYYIILNTRRSKDVPADIRGLQRLEYTAYTFIKDVGLADQLIRYILSKEYWVKKIWAKIPEAGKGFYKRKMALFLLAHLRDHEKLTPDNIRSLAQGSRLREKDRNEVIQILVELGLIKQLRNSTSYAGKKGLYSK